MTWSVPFRSCPIYINRAVVVVNKPPERYANFGMIRFVLFVRSFWTLHGLTNVPA